jgi:hypothetical protein
MKKLSFLAACLVLSFPGLNACSDCDGNRPEEPKAVHCSSQCKKKPEHKFKPHFLSALGSATFCTAEETPVQLGYIPMTAKHVSRKGIEPTATGFKVKKEGIYLVGVSFKAVGTDVAGPLTVSLSYGSCMQPECHGNTPCALSEKTTLELFKFETSGELKEFRQVTVKLSEDDVIDLTVTSLPTSGSVVYPAGTDITMIIQQVG